MTAAIEAEQLRRTVTDLVGFGSRHVLSKTDAATTGTGAARDYLEKRFREFIAGSDGRLSVARESYSVPSRRLGDDVTVVNIVATLVGVSDPARVYVVGGHYDSINGDAHDGDGLAPGANDDASGTALVIEACRVMCESPFPATIKFVCYDGEEMGLLGSAAHAAALAEAGVAVDGMITNDIVGNTMGMDGVRRNDHVRCFSYAPRGNDSSGRSLARVATFVARRHLRDFDVRLIYRGDRYGRGGDHRSFYQHGFPSIRLTEPREDYSRQHQNVSERDGQPYGDLPQYMDFAYLARVCAVNVAMLAELASAPPPPRGRLSVRGARDAYDTLLVWPAVESAADYEVVWRQTTAPDWQGVERVGQRANSGRRGLSVTLAGRYIDDLVFGVRSVGADGSRSRVATPPEPDAFYQRRQRGR